MLSVKVHPDAVFLFGQAMVALNGETSEVNARADDTFVVVRIHANRVGLQVKRVLTVLHLLQLVLVQIRPTPNPGVDHMGKAFSPGNLEATVESPLYGDALRRVGPVRRDCRDERVQLISLLLQLLHQRLDCPLAKCFRLASLSVAHETVHDGEAGIGRGGGAAPHLLGPGHPGRMGGHLHPHHLTLL
jgi:hypothetical protein